MGEHTQDSGGVLQSASVVFISDNVLQAAGLEHLLTAAKDLVYAGRVSSVDALLAAGGALPRLALMSLALCDGSDPVSNVRRLREAGVRVLAYFAGADRYQVRRAYEVAQVGVVRSWDEGPVMLEELRQALDDASGPLQRWTDVLGIDAATVVSDRLTAVEREVLMVYAAVATADYVARRLGLATNTVNKYVAKARRRYAEAGKTADSRADLVRLAQEDGLLPWPWPRAMSQVRAGREKWPRGGHRPGVMVASTAKDKETDRTRTAHGSGTPARDAIPQRRESQ